MLKKIYLLLKKIRLEIIASLIDPILMIEGIKVIEAKTNEEKEMVYHLRYKIYSEHRYVDSKIFPNKKMQDEEDSHSISFLATKKGVPVGTLRLVLGDKPIDFPTFRMYDIDIDKFPLQLSNTGEISKLAITKKNLSVQRYWVWLGLIKTAYKKSKELKLNNLIFFVSEKLNLRINKIFCTPTHLIPLLPETEGTIKQRRYMANYFKIKKAQPYFATFSEKGIF
ncbi:MAG: hypothetical protein WCX77_03500 [Candidatus Paceibacterota bacterium]|jgi:hypothetical protein